MEVMRSPLPDARLVLDFVNTLTRDEDLLATPAAAAQWWGRHTATDTPTFTEDDVARLRDLRALLAARFDGQSGGIAEQVDAQLAELRLVARLAADGTVSTELDVADAGPADVAAHLVLASLVQLAARSGLSTVRRCAAPDCLIRFSSSNPRRLWCDSRGCGNRERVRRHYRRTSGTDQTG
jgi:predicted RNA-binding Zn ribbon-like protein